MKKEWNLSPMWLLFLGACPAMGASVGVLPAIAMGVAVILTLVLMSALAPLVKKLVPHEGTLPVFVLLSTGIVSVIQLLMNAFLPSVFQMLGVYLAAAAVNLLVMHAAEDSTVADSLKTGLGFLLAVLLTALIREVFGSASIAGFSIPFLENYRIPTLTQASGGFFVYAMVAALANAIFPGKKSSVSGMTGKALGLAEKEG